MKLFIVRFLLMVIFWLLFTYVIHWGEAMIFAFVTEYVLEPLITSKL